MDSKTMFRFHAKLSSSMGGAWALCHLIECPEYCLGREKTLYQDSGTEENNYIHGCQGYSSD